MRSYKNIFYIFFLNILYTQNLICADYRLDLNKAPSNETVTLSEWYQGRKVLCLAYKDPRYPKYVDQKFAQKRKELENAGITTIEGEPMYVRLHRDYLKAKKLMRSGRNVDLNPEIKINLQRQLFADLPPALREDFLHHIHGEFDKVRSNVYLLHGPPGVGKSLSAKLCAILTQRPMIRSYPLSIPTEWKDSETENITSLLRPIVTSQDPWVIIFEFIENIKKSSEHELIAQLRKNKNKNVIIIGTTDDLAAISPALQRFFAKGIYEIPLPDFNSRKNIIELYLKEHKLDYPATLPSYIAKRTKGFAGKQLDLLIRKLYYLTHPHLKPTHNDALKSIQKYRAQVRNRGCLSGIGEYHLQEFLDSEYFYPTVTCTTIGALAIGAMLLLKTKESE
ncbi:MAG: ATP-binding protein [Candidatus Dependentiae bacterium]